MQITPDLIKYLESLARITLTEDEEKRWAQNFRIYSAISICSMNLTQQV